MVAEFAMLWRRYRLVLAQVCFFGRDLRRKMDIHALQWRRFRSCFRTCTKNTEHLRSRLLIDIDQIVLL